MRPYKRGRDDEDPLAWGRLLIRPPPVTLSFEPRTVRCTWCLEDVKPQELLTCSEKKHTACASCYINAISALSDTKILPSSTELDIHITCTQCKHEGSFISLSNARKAIRVNNKHEQEARLDALLLKLQQKMLAETMRTKILADIKQEQLQEKSNPLKQLITELKNLIIPSCPKCKNAVFHEDGGCYHLTCQYCNTEFCGWCATFITGPSARNHVETCLESRTPGRLSPKGYETSDNSWGMQHAHLIRAGRTAKKQINSFLQRFPYAKDSGLLIDLLRDSYIRHNQTLIHQNGHMLLAHVQQQFEVMTGRYKWLHPICGICGNGYVQHSTSILEFPCMSCMGITCLVCSFSMAVTNDYISLQKDTTARKERMKDHMQAAHKIEDSCVLGHELIPKHFPAFEQDQRQFGDLCLRALNMQCFSMQQRLEINSLLYSSGPAEHWYRAQKMNPIAWCVPKSMRDAVVKALGDKSG